MAVGGMVVDPTRLSKDEPCRVGADAKNGMAEVDHCSSTSRYDRP
jgi:hypothetical protein